MKEVEFKKVDLSLSPNENWIKNLINDHMMIIDELRTKVEQLKYAKLNLNSLNSEELSKYEDDFFEFLEAFENFKMKGMEE